MPGTSARSPASPRETATYLVGLRPVLAGAINARQSWVRRIGILLEDARHGNASVVAQAAGKVGRDQISIFRESRGQLDRLKPPTECQVCHAQVAAWLDQLIAVCDVLTAVGTSNDLSRLRQTQEMLALSRNYAREFNTEYTRIVSDLKTRVNEAQKERARNERRRAAEQNQKKGRGQK